ncbi:MAG: carbohydrate kinase family protein [Balneolales bacterium]|nr:carbohydrate kinase family protein [Balneolales bacterium]
MLHPSSKNPRFKSSDTTTANKDYDILVAGELNMDLILDQVNNLPDLEKEVICDGMNLTIGSSSAIMALNAAALGLNIRFVGRIGDDIFGKRCIEALHDRNIDTRFIQTTPGVQTGLTCIFTQSHKRGMITYPGAMEYLTILDLPDELLKSAQHLHISSFYLQKGLRPDVEKIFEKAKNLGLTTSFDTNFDPEEKWGDDVIDILRNVDIFFPNDTEAMAISKTNTVEDALQKLSKYSKLVVATCGSKGIRGQSENSFYHADGLKVESKDAIGAGDTFNSGFLSKFLKSDSIENCIKAGIHASAYSTCYSGGTTGFDYPTEFEAFCKSHPVTLNVSELST